MEYNGLIHAIPKNWMNGIRNDGKKFVLASKKELIVYVSEEKIYRLQELDCKHLTGIFLDKIIEKPAAKKKWEKYFPDVDIEWSQCYKHFHNQGYFWGDIGCILQTCETHQFCYISAYMTL